MKGHQETNVGHIFGHLVKQYKLMAYTGIRRKPRRLVEWSLPRVFRTLNNSRKK